jgi:PhnB protein
LSDRQNSVPAGYPPLSPYLAVTDAEQAIAFYRNALGAAVRMSLRRPDGRIAHAELELEGGGFLMLAEEMPEMGFGGGPQGAGVPVMLHLYTADVDATFARALAAGGRQLHPVANQFYGDRAGSFEDPFGHRWHVATRVETLTEEEIRARMAAMRGPC